MPEVRHDAITGAWVIVAPERASRPHTFRTPAPLPAADPDCPFCPGHEDRTPPEVARVGSGDPDGPGWRVRVTPNLYPAVDRPGSGDGRDGGPASGAHEVIIAPPAHDRSLARQSDAEAEELVGTLVARVGHHHRAGRALASAFVNHGAAAGASIEHPHGQLVALDFVPPGVDAELARVDAAGRDLVAEDLARALAGGLVVDDDGWVASWCPAAAGGPYEMIVAARDAGPMADAAPTDEVAAVARGLRRALGRLAAALGDVPHNVVVASAPAARRGHPYHWYVRVTPRLNVRAGFEHATGVLVNTVPPEVGAPLLRDAAPSGPGAGDGAPA